MFSDWVRSRSSPPSTEMDSGTSTTDCETFCAVTTTSSRLVTSGFSCDQAEFVPSAVATAAATPTALEYIGLLPALYGHDYSVGDTNVLIRELSTGIDFRAPGRPSGVIQALRQRRWPPATRKTRGDSCASTRSRLLPRTDFRRTKPGTTTPPSSRR